jgi:hypothetical protein
MKTHQAPRCTPRLRREALNGKLSAPVINFRFCMSACSSAAASEPWPRSHRNDSCSSDGRPCDASHAGVSGVKKTNTWKLKTSEIGAMMFSI